MKKQNLVLMTQHGQRCTNVVVSLDSESMYMYYQAQPCYKRQLQTTVSVFFTACLFGLLADCRI